MRWGILALLVGIWACDDDDGFSIARDGALVDAAPPVDAARDAVPDRLVDMAAVDMTVVDAAPVVDAEPDRGPPSPWPTCPTVEFTPPPAGLDALYTRHVDLNGLALVGSANVPEDAFRVATYLIGQMTEREPCFGTALIRTGVRIGIMADGEVLTDLPEFSDLATAFPETDWDSRRALSATLERPLTAVPAATWCAPTAIPGRGRRC